MEKKCILWDFDYTLAYRDGKWTQSLMNIFENNGYEQPEWNTVSIFFRTALPWNRWEEAHADYFGEKSWWEFVNGVISEAVRAAGVPEPDNRNLTEQFRSEYLRLEAWHLFEETERNLIRSREKGFSNIIVSNHTPELEWLAGQLGIASHFDRILTSALVGYDKPHGKLYEAAESAGPFDRIYMVGDNYHADVLGGRKRGYASILVRGENENDYELFAPTLDGIWQFIK